MNRISRALISGAIVLTATLGPATLAQAASAPTSPVLDGANMLSPSQEAALVRAIRADDERYDIAFVVETVTSTNGRDPEQAAVARANELGVGDAGADNGVFVFIARDDHQIRIQPGDGVAAKLPGAKLDAIIADEMTPAFRQERYLDGIEAALTSVGKTYAAPAPSAAATPAGDDGAAVTVTLAGVLIALGLLALVLVVGVIAFIVAGIRDAHHARGVARRKEAVTNLLDDLLSLDGTQEREFLDLRGDEARRRWLDPRMDPYLTKQPDFRQRLYEGAVAEYVKVYFEEAEKDLDFRWRDTYRVNVREASLREVFEKFSADTVRAREKHRAEVKRQDEEFRARIELQRQQQAEQQRREEQARVDAKQFWQGLNEQQRSSVRAARTKRDKERALTDLGMDAGNFALWFPFLLTSYPGEVGRPQAEYGGSSSSSSRSSDSGGGYSSPTISDFGGGSFSDGGGGGTW